MLLSCLFKKIACFLLCVHNYTIVLQEKYTNKHKKFFWIFSISKDCKKAAAEMKHEMSVCILIPILAVLCTQLKSKY